jgi:protein tyrosine phosphatase
VCEFWRLVWEQAIPAIVMLTKNFDLVRVMCVQYWPRSALHIQPFLFINIAVMSFIKKCGNIRTGTRLINFLHFLNSQLPNRMVNFH